MSNRRTSIADGHGYPIQKTETFAASDTITIKNGTVFITAAGAATLKLPAISASPTGGKGASEVGDDGKTLRIVSLTAQAHVIQSPTKFNSGATGAGTATFAGAVGNGVVLTAYQGRWVVLPGGNSGATLA